MCGQVYKFSSLNNDFCERFFRKKQRKERKGK